MLDRVETSEALLVNVVVMEGSSSKLRDAELGVNGAAVVSEVDAAVDLLLLGGINEK